MAQLLTDILGGTFTGATGAQGVTGTQGTSGTTGAQGATGTGSQGTTGTQGATGTQGTTGAGTQGAQGATASTASINFVIEGGGAPITAGQKGHIEVPFACTLNQWSILLDQSGSISVQIWKDSYANFPPTVADDINASPYQVTTATKNQGTLFTVSSSIAAGDILAYNVVSATTATRATISLRVAKT